MRSEQIFDFDLEGPTGPRTIRSMEDLRRLCEDFNEELNTAITQRENFREQVSNAYSLLTANERELIQKQAYKEGYDAAMLEKSTWDLS